MATTLPIDLTDGVNTFTTLVQEQAFLAALAADSPRVGLHTVGYSTYGNPINAVVVGATTAPPLSSLGRVALVVGGQHGNEPGGREGALGVAHHYAYTTDPAEVAWLGTTTLVVIPTANPDNAGLLDGDPEGTREAPGGDMNRDHHRLLLPETRAVNALIAQARPRFLMDMHENFGTDVRLEIGAGDSHPNVPAAARAETTEAGIAIGANFNAMFGFAPGPYPVGDSQIGVIRTAGAWRRAISFLAETASRHSHIGEYIPYPLIERRDWHVGAFRAFQQWIHASGTAALLAVDAAFDALADDVYGAFRIVDSVVHTDMHVKLDPPPAAYVITDAQRVAHAERLAAFYLEGEPDGPNWRYPTNTVNRIATHYLLDPRAQYPVTPDATVIMPRTPPDDDGPPPSAGSGVFTAQGDPAVIRTTSGEAVSLSVT